MAAFVSIMRKERMPAFICKVCENALASRSGSRLSVSSNNYIEASQAHLCAIVHLCVCLRERMGICRIGKLHCKPCDEN